MNAENKTRIDKNEGAVKSRKIIGIILFCISLIITILLCSFMVYSRDSSSAPGVLLMMTYGIYFVIFVLAELFGLIAAVVYRPMYWSMVLAFILPLLTQIFIFITEL